MSPLRSWLVLGLSLALATPPLICASPAAFAQANGDELPKFEDLSPERQSELASLLELAQNNEKRDNYAKALQYYMDAFKLFPHPKLYYSMALCYDRMAETNNALKYYKLYLQAQPDGEDASKAQTRVQALDQVMVRQDTSLRIDSSPPGATVYLGDITRGPVGSTPTTDLPVSPGKYTIIVKLDGYEETTAEVEVKPNDRANIKIPLTKLPGLEDPGKARSSGGSATPWVLLGVGVAAAGGAVTFALLEQGMIDDAGGVDEKKYFNEDDWKRKELYETMTYVSGAVAILSVSGALLLWLVDDSSSARAQGLSAPSQSKAAASLPTLWAAPGAAGIQFEARF